MKTDKHKEKKNNSFNIYKALNEKIVGMGYTYSLFSFLKTFLIFTLFIIILGYFHKLKYYYILILILCFFSVLPFSIYSQYKYLYEQKRFQELCVYLKNMKINYKQYQKILLALKETKENFTEEDRIYKYIVKAIDDIESGKTYREALDNIEKPYKNTYIMKLHSYIILGETEGGSAVYDALDGIDYESWRTDTYVFQTQKYKQQNQNGYYTILGLSISLGVIFLFQKILGEPGVSEVMGNVFETMAFQIATFIYILIDLISYIMVKTMITGKWIKEDE